MSLFSFLRKNKQELTTEDSAFYSRAEEDSAAVRGRGRRKNSKQANAENQPVDPVLPEKKRARRRLVGAVALVLAVIIGLPMVLDSEPKPLAEDIAIQIPSKDKPYVPTGDVKQSEPVASAGVAASTTLDAKEEFVDTPPPVVPKAVAVAPPAAKPKQPVRPPAPAKLAVVEKPDAKTDTRPEPKSDSRPDSKSEAKAENRPDPPVVKLAEKPAEKAEKPEKPAVKADDAVRAKAILEARPAADDSVAPAEKKPVKFTVQVAALASAEKVSELQEKLKTAGIRSYTQKVTTESGQRIRIRVGPFASKEEADRIKSKLSTLGLNGTVVPVNL